MGTPIPHRESETKELSMVLTHLSWRQMRGCVRGRSRQHSLTPEASSWESLDSKEGENEGTGREWTDHKKALRWAAWAQEGEQRLHPKKGWSDGAGVARCEKQGRDSLSGPMAKTPSSQCRCPGFDPWSEN